jgi:hypothetical protein
MKGHEVESAKRYRDSDEKVRYGSGGSQKVSDKALHVIEEQPSAHAEPKSVSSRPL